MSEHRCENCIYREGKNGDKCELEMQLTNHGNCEWYEPHLKPEETTVTEISYRGDVPFELVASEYHCPLCGEVLEDYQEQCENNECGCWIDWED